MVQVIKHQGKKYYIHGKNKFYYLSPKKQGCLDRMPEGYGVAKTSTGFLYLKKV